MFTLPPRPPKDYVLKDVRKTQVSAPEHTPSGLPRATQTTLGKFCSPVPASDDEPFDRSTLEEPNDRVLSLWAKQAKAWWVDRPGENAYFLNDVYNKYRVVVDDSYDPRYQHRPRVFQRSYKYELDCMEDARLKKLWRKTKREEEEENRKHQKHIPDEQSAVASCELQPPFWWKGSVGKNMQPMVDGAEDGLDPKPDQTVYQTSYLRWQDKPKLFEPSQTDPCKRREALAKFGQPFKHEACTWYFEQYPPPKVIFRPEKFSQ